MPNICSGYMHVRGYKDNVQEFCRIMKADYRYCDKNGNWNSDPNDKDRFTHIPHMFRIFSSYPYQTLHGLFSHTVIYFDCAWSTWSCMFDGEYTYFNDFERDHKGDHNGTNILRESKRLHLDIEIWAEETGMCFKEHYVISNGILIVNEEFEYQEAYIEGMPFEEFKEEYPEYCKDNNIITKEDYNKLDEIIVLKDVEEDCIHIESDEPQYICLNTMVRTIK